MSHEKFEVGEIAILQNCLCETNNGLEVEIVALPRLYDWMYLDGTWIDAGNYITKGANGTYQDEPWKLRKRRPPQDWVKLCNLTDVPREVVHV